MVKENKSEAKRDKSVEFKDLQPSEVSDSKSKNVEEENEPQPNDFLTVLEKGQKPWYLHSSEIYKLVKHAVTALPFSEGVFEKAIQGITLLTKYINESTYLSVPTFDANDVHNLVNRLDEILADNLIVLDDGLDKLRSKLSSSLRLLIAALVKHKEFIERTYKEQKDNVKKAVQSRYEQSLVVLHMLMEKVQHRFPNASSLAIKSIETIKTTVESSTQGLFSGHYFKHYISTILSHAQPYVHTAVGYSLPYVEKAVEVSKPYYERAAPFIDPLVQKAVTIENSLKDNSVVGSYVTKAIDTSYTVVSEVKSYAVPAEEVH